MAFCRWSSDDFSCDLYVYLAEAGYVIHVSSMKVVGDIPKEKHLLGFPEFTDEQFNEWYDSHQKQMEWLETAEREPIGLPFDGKSFYCCTAQECIDQMMELREMGYRFPDYAIEGILEELEVERAEG